MSKQTQTAAEVDGRDTVIERLEQVIAEERSNGARLRQMAEDLRFQLDINERSYSKQLEDARRRVDSAEHALAEQRSRNAELDAARKDAIELLSDARTELDRLAAERDQLRRRPMPRDGRQLEAAGAEPADTGDEGTINTLMNDASWVIKPEPAACEATEDMISPELVLATDRKQD